MSSILLFPGEVHSLSLNSCDCTNHARDSTIGQLNLRTVPPPSQAALLQVNCSPFRGLGDRKTWEWYAVLDLETTLVYLEQRVSQINFGVCVPNKCRPCVCFALVCFPLNFVSFFEIFSDRILVISDA